MSKLVILLGPTAVGKTRLAALLAHKFNGEIISADSRQVYTGMDIGTGKDLEDYNVNGTVVPYHLVDVIEPTEEFNLFSFAEKFISVFSDITERGKLPFLVGGTALYIDAVLKRYELSKVDFEKRKKELEKLPLEVLQKKLLELKPDLHNKTDLLSKHRAIRAIIVAEDSKPDSVLKFPDFNELVIGIKIEREKLKERIKKRLKERLQNGMIEEAERLVRQGVSLEKLKFFGLEYKYLAMYLNKEIGYEEMEYRLGRDIAKFAKRQMTWFRKIEREGTKIHWIAPMDFDAAERLIEKFLTTGN